MKVFFLFFFLLGTGATLRSYFSETKIWSGERRLTLSIPQDRFRISCFSSIGQIFLIFLKINILQLGHFAGAIFKWCDLKTQKEDNFVKVALILSSYSRFNRSIIGLIWDFTGMEDDRRKREKCVVCARTHWQPYLMTKGRCRCRRPSLSLHLTYSGGMKRSFGGLQDAAPFGLTSPGQPSFYYCRRGSKNSLSPSIVRTIIIPIRRTARSRSYPCVRTRYRVPSLQTCEYLAVFGYDVTVSAPFLVVSVWKS